jgi:polyhydroxybutyrate depolymerase
MNVRSFALALLAVALLSATCSKKSKTKPPVGTAASAAGHATEGTVRTADGRERHYRLYTPSGYPSGPLRPLLLVLHGGGGSAEGAEKTSFTHAAADKHGVIAVYPDGIAQRVLGKAMETWNGGYCCGEAAKQGVDDTAFIVQLLDELKKTVRYDPKRVYATGISNGAIMATRLACERPDRVAAIAGVANPGYIADCKNPRPVGVQIIHGTADGCARFDGGASCGGCWERAVEKWLGIPMPPREFPCNSVADQAAFWRRVNGCSDVAKSTYDHGKAHCSEYSECSSHRSVSVCIVDGGGHTWPGGELGCDESKAACRSFAEVTGAISRDMDANDVMTEFFTHYALP